ncbi:hypothetical protein V8C37DRAFT_374247, partial [Trichoderma ceciliae]
MFLIYDTVGRVLAAANDEMSWAVFLMPLAFALAAHHPQHEPASKSFLNVSPTPPKWSALTSHHHTPITTSSRGRAVAHENKPSQVAVQQLHVTRLTRLKRCQLASTYVMSSIASLTRGPCRAPRRLNPPPSPPWNLQCVFGTLRPSPLSPLPSLFFGWLEAVAHLAPNLRGGLARPVLPLQIRGGKQRPTVQYMYSVRTLKPDRREDCACVPAHCTDTQGCLSTGQACKL